MCISFESLQLNSRFPHSIFHKIEIDVHSRPDGTGVIYIFLGGISLRMYVFFVR